MLFLQWRMPFDIGTRGNGHTMAAVHAGIKRSFEAMSGHDVRMRPSQSLPASRRSSQSPINGTAIAVNASGISFGASPAARKIAFEPDASIIIIGIRGVGKSSLGFLAASAYNRKLVESERVFSDVTGSTSAAYRKLQGTVEYHRKHSEIFSDLLAKHDKNSVIVCGFSDLENDGAKLLQSFAQNHPVIYVTRDARGIQSHLRVWSTERIRDVIRASEALLRECSNYEFWNVSEQVEQQRPTADANTHGYARASHGPSLTLKRTEHDFLKLLRNIIGDQDRVRSHQSAYPLSQISVDRLDYTSAVVLSVEDIVNHHIDLDTAQIGADAVELCFCTHSIDHREVYRFGKHNYFNMASEAFAALKRSTILPIILTVLDHESTSHKSALTMPDLLGFCLRLGPDYCTLDLSLDEALVQSIIKNKGRTRIIGSFDATSRQVNSSNTEELFQMYEKARRYECELAKITSHTTLISDTFAIVSLQQRITSAYGDDGPRLIAYCVGKAGRTSMCFNRVLTPVLPIGARPAHSPQLQSLHLAQMTAKSRNQALFASFVHESLRFLIYGADVSFSLSPAMHNAAYTACGMPHTYRTHSASNLDDFMNLVREPDFGGAAIVQPFKTTTLPMMDLLSPHAKAIGALNTVIPLRDELAIQSMADGRGMYHQRNRTGTVKALYGDNTDWIGIRACIRRGLSPANTVRPQSTGLVCGAGGMARAAIYAMISLGVQTIFVCNRTQERTEQLAEHFNKLIKANAIAELSPANAASTVVIALKSFASEWQKEFRYPTMIVSCIPTQTTDDRPTDFVLPQDWLGSRTGGVVVEVSSTLI